MIKNNCKCISYNKPKSYQTNEEKILKMVTETLPDGTKKYKDICIDYCIANDIQKLWDNNIFTSGSCCGHNGEFGKKNVIILHKDDYQKAKTILPNFKIMYWDLVEATKN